MKANKQIKKGANKIVKEVLTESKEEKKTEAKKQINILKIAAYVSLVIIVAAVIGGSIQVMIRAGSLNPDESLITFIYILGAGWMFAIVMIIPIIIARKEILNKFKIFGRKSKVVIFRMIGGDANEDEIVLKLKGNTVEIGENKLIFNPRKSTMRDGVRVITYVADNALSHDYFQDSTKTLKQIGQKLSANRDENFHDIYSDPIRIDAKYFNETFLAAQQTNPDILKKIIAFLTSKSIISILVIIAVAAGISAVLGLQANNLLNAIPFCNPTSITP